MLRSRKLSSHEDEYEPKRKRSTSLDDMREKLRVENRLHKAQRNGGGILDALKKLNFNTSKANASIKKQSDRMPEIFERKVP